MKAHRVERSVLAAFSAILAARLAVWLYVATGDWIPTTTDVRSASQSAVLIVIDLVLLIVVLTLHRRGSSSRTTMALLLAAATVPVFLDTAWLQEGLVLLPGDEDLALGSLPLSVDLLIIQVLLAWQFGLAVVVATQVVAVVVDLILIRRVVPLGSELATQTLEELAYSSVITIIICAVIVYLAGRLRNRTDDLLEANRNITSYAARVETAAALEERHRLARELHDTLAHSLSGLTIQLGAIDARWDDDPAGARHQLNEAEHSARAGLSEARRAMQALTASPLEDLGLRRALSADIERTVDNGCATTITWGELPELDGTTELQVYRIIQEAVRNCSRHANATTLDLTVSHVGDYLCVTVSDDGIGFDPAHLDPDRNGLRSMRERAATLGGRLTVESRLGEGTSVEAMIPIGTRP